MLQRRKRKATSRRWALRSSRQLSSSQPSAPALTYSRGCALAPVVAASPASPEVSAGQAVKQWAPVLGVRMLLLAVGGVCQGWRSRLAQVCAGLLNALLYWRGYTQQLESLQQQVTEMKREINVLHCALQFAGEARAICCRHGGSVEVGMMRPPLPYGSAVDPLPALTLPAPPPPPPPPPPPLPPPLPVLLLKNPLLSIKRRATPKILEGSQEKQSRSVSVTLSDLQAVKLRKITDPISQKKTSPAKKSAPLVTVADLQKVRLRRSLCQLPSKLCQNLNGSPNKSTLSLRSHLKKVQIDRSPGGTPLVDKENRETGTGLTPLMTQALRRKFQSALPRSPSPKSRSTKSISELNSDLAF
ncbi:proline-rich protein 11 isoform X2 [Conger conger]|nr:proline-rich protein 11 isoform X2 [Conger conger]